MSIEEQVKAIVEEQVGNYPGNADKIERLSVIAVLDNDALLTLIEEAQESFNEVNMKMVSVILADLYKGHLDAVITSQYERTFTRMFGEVFEGHVTTYVNAAMDTFGDDLTPHPIERIDAMEEM